MTAHALLQLLGLGQEQMALQSPAAACRVLPLGLEAMLELAPAMRAQQPERWVVACPVALVPEPYPAVSETLEVLVWLQSPAALVPEPCPAVSDSFVWLQSPAALMPGPRPAVWHWRPWLPMTELH